MLAVFRLVDANGLHRIVRNNILALQVIGVLFGQLIQPSDWVLTSVKWKFRKKQMFSQVLGRI